MDRVFRIADAGLRIKDRGRVVFVLHSDFPDLL